MSYFGGKNGKMIEILSSDEEVTLLSCQDSSTSKHVNKGASSSKYNTNYGVNMWIKMKTCVITNDEDICKILDHNNIQLLNNSFEINVKDVKKYTKQQTNRVGMDIITLKTYMVPLQQQNNSSMFLSRLTGKISIVNCVNIKNDKGEYFSSFVNNLSKNDRILITDGVVLNNSLDFYNNFTVAVRPENHSSVFLFKYKSPSLKESKFTVIKNLSKITGCGTYSLFGHITKIIKYIDEEFMLLRIQCFDKCSIKTRKYPQYVNEFKNISKEENKHGIKYDSSSDNIDILVRNPCQQFITLKLNQKIHLNNVKVNYSSDFELFALHVKGKLENLKADPIETGDVNSLIPPRRYFPIPNELKPVSQLKTKQILCDVQMDFNDKFQKLNKINSKLNLKSSLKNLPLRTKQSKNYEIIDLSCSSSDDNVNLSPCQDFLTSNNISNTDNNINKSTSESFWRKGIENYTENRVTNCSPSKIPKISNSRIDKQVKKCNNSTPIKRKASLIKENSSGSSTDHSYSPSFFKTSEIQPETLNQKTQSKKLDLNDTNSTQCKSEIQPETLNQKTQSKKLDLNDTNSTQCKSEIQPETLNQKTQSKKLDLNDKNSTQCIGPCRLIHIENPDNIVCGYCVTCFAFFPKSLLIQLNMKNYECPKCFNTVHLTFFFKMNFLYGKYDRQAIEVCCYNDDAKHVIKKMLKKKITLEDYSSNHDIRKLFIDTTTSFISNKTKVNIIVTPKDDTYILLAVDTKYIITNSMD